MTPHLAIESLCGRVAPLADTLQRLRSTVSQANLLDLYQAYFPAEFGREGATWGNHEGVIRNFLRLVDQRLFPCLGSESLDELWEEGVDVSEIHLYAPWPAWYEFDDLDDAPALVLAILLATERIRETGNQVFRYDQVEAHNWTAVHFDLRERVQTICAALPAPLQYLPDAVVFTLKGADNLWIDLTDEEMHHCGEWPVFSRESIDYLAREWVEAKAIAERVAALRSWVGGRENRGQQVFDLIRQAMQAPTRRVRLRAGPVPLSRMVEHWEERWEEDDEA